MSDYSSTASRALTSVLVVTKHDELRSQLCVSLKSLGYGRITAVSSHGAGLERINALSHGRSFAFVLYDARASDISPLDFTKLALQHEPELSLIPASAQPHIDDVFGLLQAGSRGFLAVPFTSQTLEYVIIRAQDGTPFSSAVLRSSDRNTALVGLTLHCLYRLTVLLRQSREFVVADAQIEAYRMAFREAAELAQLYCIDGDLNRLLQTIEEQCIARANVAASRLGRTRWKLRRRRLDAARGIERGR